MFSYNILIIFVNFSEGKVMEEVHSCHLICYVTSAFLACQMGGEGDGEEGYQILKWSCYVQGLC
jgi:hypothetical protein